MPVSHRKSLQDLPWECFTFGRNQHFQKRPVTGRPKYGRAARHGPEIRKNRFSLWIPVYHLKSLQDLPWRCFTKSRSQDIQKQRVTGRPKWGRPVCHWDLCAKNPKNRFSLLTPVPHPESLQDLPWKSKMKTRGPNIQKRSITDSSKQNCAYSNPYSQAVTHPSTNGSQPCLTSVIGRELVFSR